MFKPAFRFFLEDGARGSFCRAAGAEGSDRFSFLFDSFCFIASWTYLGKVRRLSVWAEPVHSDVSGLLADNWLLRRAVTREGDRGL